MAPIGSIGSFGVIDAYKNNVESRNIYKVDLTKNYTPIPVVQYAQPVTSGGILDNIYSRWSQYISEIKSFMNEANSSIVQQVYAKTSSPTQFNYFNPSLSNSFIGRNVNLTA